MAGLCERSTWDGLCAENRGRDAARASCALFSRKLGALTPTEFVTLKRHETQLPEEGHITGGLYL